MTNNMLMGHGLKKFLGALAICKGNILYRFSSLQRTAGAERNEKEYVGNRLPYWDGHGGEFLKEKTWQFSKASILQGALVISLGALHLLGVIILGIMLKNSTGGPSSYISLVSKIFPLLQIYAGSFFTIPMIRWLLVPRRNFEIEKKNQAREQYARALQSPDLPLRRKLLSARDMAQRTFIDQDRIVYSTNRDLHEQDNEVQQREESLNEVEKSE